MSTMTTCDICGEDDDEVGFLPVLVAVQDGSTRNLRCCDVCREAVTEAWSRRIRRLPDDAAPLRRTVRHARP